ncbi:hypothetical protein FP2506_08141 [Fulvimarina pelagi HTCC2506]|uniref:Uncharacterized protein n=1 Tax=Fulvimarina pelagi HTCC2506 TaxID=314231 RepID=Q0G6B8_9HYPH|nr:hypothetical protein [Fulvimarina pelagi]EAU42796.1 hypothetical protein FP2506_08141 [Fulvimarina pelagi HTCC2506]
MDDSVNTSRWGVTVWTVAVFAAFLALGFLFAGGEPVAVAVAAG